MSTPVKIGLVGIGRAGWGMHCNELERRKEKFQIVAACDVEENRLEKMRVRYPDIRTYSSIQQLLEDAQVELVDIATPSTLHTEHAILALRAKKPVFLEKPIATSLEDAKKMVAESEYLGVPLYFRHNRRFEAGFQHIREIIASGVLGTVFEIRLHRHNYQRRNDWQTLMSEGGGQLNNWGPHIIDHSLRFLDGQIDSIWSDLKRIAAVGDAEDQLKIIFKGKNGAIVDMEISGGVAKPQPTYVVFGSRGSLVSDEREIELRYLNPEQKLQEISAVSDSPPIDGGFGNEEELEWVEKTIAVQPQLEVRPDSIWDYLYETIRDGAPFPIETKEALQVMEVIDQVKKGTPFAG
ncbi:MAG: Gfo/Idh/MocA family protein [Spirochaetales bacterium]